MAWSWGYRECGNYWNTEQAGDHLLGSGDVGQRGRFQQIVTVNNWWIRFMNGKGSSIP